MRSRSHLFLLVVFTVENLFPYNNSVVRPTRSTEPARIDGLVEEKEWGKATVVSDFVQRFPKEGGEPFEKTIVYLMYTKTDLFVAMKAYDSKLEGIVATVMKRDDFEITKNDQFAIAIDS